MSSSQPLVQRRANANPHPFFENDNVLPIQFFEKRKPPQSGEERLFEAVLEDAIDVLKWREKVQHIDLRQRQLLRDTLAWVASEQRAWPFDFENLCDVLHLDIEATRKALLAGTMGRLKRPGVIVQQDRRPSVGMEPAAYGANASAYAPAYVAKPPAVTA